MFSLTEFLKGLSLQNAVDRTIQLILIPDGSTGTSTTITTSQTANRTITFPDSTDTLSTASSTEILTNKTISGSSNTLTNISISSLNSGPPNEFVLFDGSGNPTSGNTVPTGTVVGTTDTQTLINKTMSGSNNTFTNLPSSGLAPIAANTVLGNITGSSAAPVAVPATSTSSNSSVVVRDANANINTNNYITGLATTNNTGTTTTLLVNSSENQVFYGTGNQTVQLPSATTLTNGQSFTISNESTGIVTVNDGSGSLLQTMQAHTHVTVFVTNTSSTAGVWDVNYALASDSSGNITGAASLALNSGGLSISGNTMTANGSSTLTLTTNATFENFIETNRTIQMSSTSINPARIVIQDALSSSSNDLILKTASLTAARTFLFPDASTTGVGTDATQTLTNKTVGDALTMAQIVTPSNPASGKDKLYVKSDDHAYILTSAGVETKLGSFAQTIRTLGAGATTILATDQVLLVGTSSGNAFLTLPTVSTVTGQTFIFKKTTNDSNFVEIESGAALIDGIANMFLYQQYDELEIISNGTTWEVVNTYWTTQNVYSNSGFSQTSVPNSDTWFNCVGNNVLLNGGVWSLTATVQYGNNGSNPGYGNKWVYWCAGTGNNTSTNPATLSTITGLTVLGGFPTANIDNSSTDATSMVVYPPIVLGITQTSTIFVGIRAVASTIANVRIVPTITATRIG